MPRIKILDDVHQDMKEVQKMNLRCNKKKRIQWKVLKKLIKGEKVQYQEAYWMLLQIPLVLNKNSSC
jgi:hypothetical protein